MSNVNHPAHRPGIGPKAHDTFVENGQRFIIAAISPSGHLAYVRGRNNNFLEPRTRDELLTIPWISRSWNFEEEQT